MEHIIYHIWHTLICERGSVFVIRGLCSKHNIFCWENVHFYLVSKIHIFAIWISLVLIPVSVYVCIRIFFFGIQCVPSIVYQTEQCEIRPFQRNNLYYVWFLVVFFNFPCVKMFQRVRVIKGIVNVSVIKSSYPIHFST